MLSVFSIKKIISILATLLLFISASAETKVAVYIKGNISEENTKNENFKKIFSSRLTSAIAQIPEFTALELNDSFIDALVYENNRRISDDANEDSLSEAGKKYGANYIVAVELIGLFEETFVTSHMIDVENAKVVYAYDTSGKVVSMSQLTALADSVADGLILAPYRKEQEKKAAEKRKAAEERKDQERKHRNSLRSTAIANLIPSGCIIIDNFIAQVEPITVDISVSDDKAKIEANFSLPAGFRLATRPEIRSCLNAMHMPYGHYTIDKNISTRFNSSNSEHSSEYYKKRLCEWCMYTVYNPSQGYIYSNRNTICTTERKKKQLVITSKEDIYAIAVSKEAAPTETEIQAEIDRLIKEGY